MASAARWLHRVNARHPWSHNEHFHGWILRDLPERRQLAVDVGCGTGLLAGKLGAVLIAAGIASSRAEAIRWAIARIREDPASAALMTR